MRLIARIAGLAALVLASPGASALDKVKVAIGQGTTFDTAFAIAGKTAGFFERHGIDPEFLVTSGGGETLQAVISGSVDIGIAAGTTGVLGAFAKGAPVRVISAQYQGTDESYVYVPAASPIKSFRETDGKTVAFSTVGASTYTLVTGLAERHGVKPKFVATGSIPATYAATMSGQVDVGWAAVPFGLQDLKDGKIRALGWGSEAGAMSTQTVRVNITHAGMLAGRRDALANFMAAYEEALEWSYKSPEALKAISTLIGFPEALVDEVRSKHMSLERASTREVRNLEQSMKDAIEFKYITAPLTAAQLAELFQMNAVLAGK